MNLRTLYEKLTGDQRRALAAKVEINPEYLYQLATGRRKPSVALMGRLCAADKRLKPQQLVSEFSE